MRLAGHLTFRFRAWCEANVSLVGENPTRSVPGFCRGARVYGKTTAAMHDIEHTPSSRPLTLQHPNSPVQLLLELKVCHTRHAPAGTFAEVDHPQREAAGKGVTFSIGEAVAARRPTKTTNKKQKQTKNDNRRARPTRKTDSPRGKKYHQKLKRDGAII